MLTDREQKLVSHHIELFCLYCSASLMSKLMGLNAVTCLCVCDVVFIINY